MDKREAIDIAIRYADAVKLKYDCVKIILFGSFAKGNYRDESDIDIAVILKDYNNKIETQLDVMRIRRVIDSRIEPHPFRLDDFNINDPIVNEIVKHGMDISVTNA